MTQKRKICMLGATGVGKTSLVARFVHSIFSDIYRTTVGVTIDKTRVRRSELEVDLVIWDLSGEDEFQSVQLSYLRGAAGYLLVIDGTRPETASTAISLQASAEKRFGSIPLVLVVNKIDLLDDDRGDIDAELARRLAATGWPLDRTSARTGAGVERAFVTLVDAVLERERQRGLHELRQ